MIASDNERECFEITHLDPNDIICIDICFRAQAILTCTKLNGRTKDTKQKLPKGCILLILDHFAEWFQVHSPCHINPLTSVSHTHLSKPSCPVPCQLASIPRTKLSSIIDVENTNIIRKVFEWWELTTIIFFHETPPHCRTRISVVPFRERLPG